MGRRALWLALLLGVAAFCVVQDRVTAAGARRYVALQRDAIAGRAPFVSVDEVMRPAIRRSVQLGVLSAGGAFAGGLGVVFLGSRLARRIRR